MHWARVGWVLPAPRGVRRRAGRCRSRGPDSRLDTALAAWAAVHGLATLVLDGALAHLSPDERSALSERLLDIVEAGIDRAPDGSSSLGTGETHLTTGGRGWGRRHGSRRPG